ncbi:MAG: hypothetical protein QXP42_04405 [Candidatus Micrarchaeia archaeon]
MQPPRIKERTIIALAIIFAVLYVATIVDLFSKKTLYEYEAFPVSESYEEGWMRTDFNDSGWARQRLYGLDGVYLLEHTRASERFFRLWLYTDKDGKSKQLTLQFLGYLYEIWFNDKLIFNGTLQNTCILLNLPADYMREKNLLAIRTTSNAVEAGEAPHCYSCNSSDEKAAEEFTVLLLLSNDTAPKLTAKHTIPLPYSIDHPFHIYALDLVSTSLWNKLPKIHPAFDIPIEHYPLYYILPYAVIVKLLSINAISAYNYFLLFLLILPIYILYFIVKSAKLPTEILLASLFIYMSFGSSLGFGIVTILLIGTISYHIACCLFVLFFFYLHESIREGNVGTMAIAALLGTFSILSNPRILFAFVCAVIALVISSGKKSMRNILIVHGMIFFGILLWFYPHANTPIYSHYSHASPTPQKCATWTSGFEIFLALNGSKLLSILAALGMLLSLRKNEPIRALSIFAIIYFVLSSLPTLNSLYVFECRRLFQLLAFTNILFASLAVYEMGAFILTSLRHKKKSSLFIVMLGFILLLLATYSTLRFLSLVLLPAEMTIPSLIAYLSDASLTQFINQSTSAGDRILVFGTLVATQHFPLSLEDRLLEGNGGRRLGPGISLPLNYEVAHKNGLSMIAVSNQYVEYEQIRYAGLNMSHNRILSLMHSSLKNSSGIKQVYYDPYSYSLYKIENTSIFQIPHLALPLEYNFSAERMEIKGNALRDTNLTITRPFSPRWKAFVNGIPAEIEKTPEYYMRIKIPNGEFSVVMEYDYSFSEKLSMLVSVIAIASLLIVAVLSYTPFKSALSL